MGWGESLGAGDSSGNYDKTCIGHLRASWKGGIPWGCLDRCGRRELFRPARGWRSILGSPLAAHVTLGFLSRAEGLISEPRFSPANAITLSWLQAPYCLRLLRFIYSFEEMTEISHLPLGLWKTSAEILQAKHRSVPSKSDRETCSWWVTHLMKGSA